MPLTDFDNIDPSDYYINWVNFDQSLPQNLLREIATIPKPFMVVGLFPEVGLSICRPLDPPFDKFAITHHGTVFQYSPLITTKLFEEDILDPSYVVSPRYPNGYQTVRLISPQGYDKTFLVHRLILDRFYNIPMTERIHVDFLDGDISNPHMANLEVVIRGK